MDPDLIETLDRARAAERAERRHDLATVAAALATLAGIASVFMWITASAHRPPCPDGYVRFLDWDGLCIRFSVVLALVGGTVTAAARRWPQLWGVCLAAALVIGLVASTVFLAGATTWQARRHEAVDSCWTF